MALAPAGPIGGNASSTITSVAFHLIRFTAFSTFSQGEEAFIAMRFHHAWLISLIIAISHSRFSHPTIACSAASQFNPTGVHVRNRFFGTFLTQESTVPLSPAYALCCFSMPSLSAISAMNSPLVGLSSGMATRQPNARFSDSTRPRLQATSMAWRMARSTLLGLVA